MRFFKKLHIPLLVLVFALGAFFRFWAAPLSSGPDDGQFWAFAKVFQIHGLDFYRYANAQIDIFPVKGWGYVYPPIWLLILRLALFATPASYATDTYVDVGWRVAMKTPIILADLGIAAIIYWVVPGSKWKKLLFATIWLFLPAAWYESGVFGQFDAVAVAFLLLSLVLFERGNNKLAFLFAGLAVMTKQYTIIPVAMMLLIASRQMTWRQIITNYSIIAGLVVILSVPFLVTGNFAAYARSLFMPGWQPDYQHPLLYAFSGSSSLLTYLHDRLGWQTSGLMHYNMPLLAAAVVAAIFFCFRKKMTVFQGAFAGALLFIALSYQVNYQYLILLMPLALLAAARAKCVSERVLTLLLALLPSVWLWRFDVTFWFTKDSPASYWVIPYFHSLSMTHRGLPDVIYVIFAFVLMCLCLACVFMLFLRWHKAKKPKYISAPLA